MNDLVPVAHALQVLSDAVEVHLFLKSKSLALQRSETSPEDTNLLLHVSVTESVILDEAIWRKSRSERQD